MTFDLERFQRIQDSEIICQADAQWLISQLGKAADDNSHLLFTIQNLKNNMKTIAMILANGEPTNLPNKFDDMAYMQYIFEKIKEYRTFREGVQVYFGKNPYLGISLPAVLKFISNHGWRMKIPTYNTAIHFQKIDERGNRLTLSVSTTTADDWNSTVAYIIEIISRTEQKSPINLYIELVEIQNDFNRTDE